MVSNLFGTLERAKYIFRDAFENVQRAIQLKVDPGEALRQPLRYWRGAFCGSADASEVGPDRSNYAAPDQSEFIASVKVMA